MVTGAAEATLPNHWQQHRVGLQMEQQAQLATTKRITTAVALQPFQVATVASMEHSTTLASTVIGGVLRSTLQQLPTVGSWATLPAL
jgi:hypothetical protein